MARNASFWRKVMAGKRGASAVVQDKEALFHIGIKNWLRFGLILFCGLAHADSDNVAKPPKIVILRGQDSQIAEINMGPEATDFWRRLQSLVEKPELKNFSRLVDILKLDIAHPVDWIDLDSPTAVWREDIKSKDYFITGGSYGVGIASNEARQRFISIRLDLDLRLVCISKLEIQRYLRTVTEVTESGPADIEYVGIRDHSGIPHSVGSSRKGVSFMISQSGCAKSVGFMYMPNKNTGD